MAEGARRRAARSGTRSSRPWALGQLFPTTDGPGTGYTTTRLRFEWNALRYVGGRQWTHPFPGNRLSGTDDLAPRDGLSVPGKGWVCCLPGERLWATRAAGHQNRKYRRFAAARVRPSGASGGQTVGDSAVSSSQSAGWILPPVMMAPTLRPAKISGWLRKAATTVADEGSISSLR